jgi:hypothetical protein
VDKDKSTIFFNISSAISQRRWVNTEGKERKTMAGFFWPEDGYGKWQGCHG